MKKLAIAALFVAALYRLHVDLEKRAANWGGKATWVPLDREEFVERMNAAIDDPNHPSWAAIRAADKAWENMRKLSEEDGDDGKV